MLSQLMLQSTFPIREYKLFCLYRIKSIEFLAFLLPMSQPLCGNLQTTHGTKHHEELGFEEEGQNSCGKGTT